MSQKIIELLNKDRADELSASIQYMKHGYDAEGIESPGIIELAKEIAKDLDRDWNSSINIENEGLRKLNKSVDTVRIDFKPVEIGSSTLDMKYFNDIPYVKASLVNEAGSLTALA